MRQRRSIALLAAVATAAAAPVALAASKNGITPVAPKAGSTVPAGKSPTFKARVTGAGTVWLHVCKSARRSKQGLICHKEVIVQMKKKSGIFQVKPRFYDYPAFWLNNPGTYYWQAHRISCEGNLNDCNLEGPIVKFKVG